MLRAAATPQPGAYVTWRRYPTGCRGPLAWTTATSVVAGQPATSSRPPALRCFSTTVMTFGPVGKPVMGGV